MIRLALLMFSVLSITFVGWAIIFALMIGQDTLVPILISAALGFVVALPVSWLFAVYL